MNGYAKALLLAFMVLPLTYGCTDMDPFGLSGKDVSGDYYLEKWEDGETYYLHDSERAYEDFEHHGPIGGLVIEIGWNDHFIVVKRRAHFGGKVDGWIVVDTRRKSILGPFSWNQIEGNQALQGLKIMQAAEAWNQL